MAARKVSTNQLIFVVVGVMVLLFLTRFLLLPAVPTTPHTSTPSLTDTTWVWQQTLMSDGTVITPAQEGVFSLTFDNQGQVSGRTDCNGFFGTYARQANNLEFGPFASTLMFCENSQEAEFNQLVSTSTSYLFDEDGNLVLLLPYDSGASIFVPQPSAAQ